MIRKRLQLIWQSESGVITTAFYDSWKKIHIHLFEQGLYDEFQVTDENGEQVLYYHKMPYGKYELKFSEKVPGSILFEIVNKHASAKL